MSVKGVSGSNSQGRLLNTEVNDGVRKRQQRLLTTAPRHLRDTPRCANRHRTQPTRGREPGSVQKRSKPTSPTWRGRSTEVTSHHLRPPGAACPARLHAAPALRSHCPPTPEARPSGPRTPPPSPSERPDPTPAGKGAPFAPVLSGSTGRQGYRLQPHQRAPSPSPHRSVTPARSTPEGTTRTTHGRCRRRRRPPAPAPFYSPAEAAPPRRWRPGPALPARPRAAPRSATTVTSLRHMWVSDSEQKLAATASAAPGGRGGPPASAQPREWGRSRG